MSGIVKLRISGVRAFDNYDFQEIEFLKPLTLISGANGVGKTTIIECLRYITTGDLPPNAKGGAFVHDPRMSDVAVVRAQVMLLYTGADSRRMVVTRSMQLSVRNKSSATFKSLDGNLKIYSNSSDFETGGVESGSISSRCADLNRQVPLSLGVPPAILNYVIFCHQEDSLWPLSEAATVKKRFDEIFEATKYTKALESLKTVRKEYMTSIRVDQVQVQHLKEDNKRCQEKQKSVDSINMQVSALKNECTQLQVLRQQNESRLADLINHGERLQNLKYAHKEAVGICTQLTENIGSLESEIAEVLEETSETELREQLQNTDAQLRELQKEPVALNKKKQSNETRLNEIETNLRNLANKRGRIEQAEDQKNKRIKQLKVLTKNDANWLKTTQKELTELEEDLEDLEISHREKEQELNQRLSAAEAEKLTLRRSLAEKSKLVTETNAQIGKLKREISAKERMLVDDSQIRKRVEKTETEISELNSKIEDFNAKNSLSNALNEVEIKEKEAVNVRKLLQKAIDASSAQSRVNYLTDDLESVKTKCQQLVSQLNVGGGEDANPETAISTTKSVIADNEKTVLDFNKKIEDLDSQIRVFTNKIASMQSELKSVTSKAQKLSSKLPDNYEEALRVAENNVLESTEQLEQLQFAHNFFSRALESAETCSKCILCDDTKSPDKQVVFISRIKAKLQALDITPEQAEKEIATSKDKLATLRDLSPMNSELKHAESEKMKLKTQISEFKTQKSTLETERNSLNEKSGSIENLQMKNEELRGLISNLNRLLESQQELTKKVEFESSLISQGVDMSPQTAQTKLEAVESGLKNARLRVETERSEIETLSTQLNSIQQTKQKLQLQLSEAEKLQEGMSRLKQRLQEVTNDLETWTSEIKTFESKLEPTNQEIKEASTTLREHKHTFAKEEKLLAEKRRAIITNTKKYDEIQAEIESFDSTYGTNPVQAIITDSERLQHELIEINNANSVIDDELKELERRIIDFNGYIRNINDNFRLRSLKTKLQTASENRDLYATKLQEMSLEFSDYEREVTTMQSAIGKLNHDIAQKSGESRALENQARQILHELASTYKDTADLYAEAVARLETTEKTTVDIAKCVKALDASIMEYHKTKMSEINSLLDELWRNTYTGTDIDTIMIRSESDVGSASVRASYNYRVCMIKRDTELDMRGRCSAGQKVLACILIRMALAECFGNNCGLLVLDEPTTNLDHNNIDSLARSLDDVIAARIKQSNFQLIVITHDERFLRQMNPSQYCNSYYRIERDQHELSKIRQVPVTFLNT